MNIKNKYLLGLGTVACLLLAPPSFAKGKKWCCQKDGKVQLFPDNSKKMCVKGKKAPSKLSKATSKRGKYFAACDEAGGTWELKKGVKSAATK